VTKPLAAILLVLAGSLTGCGYKAGGPFRSDIRTVYVAMVGSKEIRRDLEFMLTEAIKKRIGSDTPYRLAPRQKADTILEAEILEERQTAFAPDFQTHQPREKALSLAVKVQWKDVRTGRLLVDQPALLQTVDYVPPAGQTGTHAELERKLNSVPAVPPGGESEKFAQDKAIDRLAARIVATMYEEW
jgi:hypothetical protein